MKKLVYMTRFNTDAPENGGVLKKVYAQLNAFKSNGVEAVLCSVNPNGLFVDSLLVHKFGNNSKFRSYYYDYYHHFLNHFRNNSCDIIYIRFFLSDFLFIRFLKSLKRINPSCQIILELPTYPYRGEHHTLTDKIRYSVDALCSRFLKKYITKIVTYSKDTFIFGIPTIQSSNGIELTHNFARRPENGNHINLIAIANLSDWHAFDRLINGLDAFVKHNPDSPYSFTFHVVGSGKAFDYLKSLAAALQLENTVILHGNKSLSDIEDLICSANLAIGTLGLHRIGIADGSTLKSREYCAMGIPFVISSNDEDFPDSLPFVKYVSSEELPVDIGIIVSYYETIREQQKVLSESMKQFAKENLTWDIKIKKILEKLNHD